ncbi:MAG: family 1 glycosylhydrolase [Pyrinomonadaceae bacterium MAG19_C2-C3]|nr:family 1 glycosylhydrolase [Pyrinomonadaceae bacterium MAG19_C2-C3]
MKYYQPRKRPNPTTQRFIFATGIECSYPTIETPNGVIRQDELEKCHHYERWREDLQLTVDLGIRFLRYGTPYYRVHTAPGKYDWAFTDEVLAEMRRLRIIPIIDLCHFGVPDWIGDFQNPDFCSHFADYARAFAERYSWVQFYTPVNEMYIAAEFSAFYGWWNERLKTHTAFVTALKHMVRANVEAMLKILEVRPDALFIQSESSEYTHPCHPDLTDEAEMLNERRFLSLDLNYGHRVSSAMYEYVRDNGMTDEEYDFFMMHNLREHCIIGNDYYAANEHLLVDETRRVYGGEIFGYYVVTKDYYTRYNLPLMCTETNKWEPDAERWMWKTWANIQRLRHDGVPVCGMTWYSLIDQVDWDTALRENNGNVNPLGLYDLDRKIRAVGVAYKNLIEQWNFTPLLPNGPLTLVGQWDIAAEQSG